MAGRRKNGEGSWGTKKIHGDDYVYYRDIDGKYYYGKNSKIVKEKIKQEKSKAKISAPDLEKQTFGEYMITWLHSIRKGIEVTIYQPYLDAVNSRLPNYRGYDLANVRLKDLNDKMFQAYLNSLAENYSLNSIKKVWGLIKTCVRYAEARGDIKPLYLGVTVTTPSEANVAVKKKDIKVPSSDEIRLIYDEAVSACSNGVYKYGNAAFVVILIMYTGMRVSEAIGLQWKDVDMERREIAVNQSLAMVKDVEKGDISYNYKIKAAKTKDSRRKILLPDKAFEALLHFRKYYQGEEGFVCVNDKNQNHYTRKLVERTLERIVKNSKSRDKCGF